MPRRRPIVKLHMDRSVKLALLATAGVSAGYLLWKWLGDGGENGGTESKKRKRKEVPGLLNVGNTCFMNVILQSVASCPSFVSWLDEFVKVCEKDKKHVYMAEILLKILKILTGDTEHDSYCYDPSELLMDMSGRGWQISSDEQDAHEFFHAAMTTLLEEYHHQADRDSKPLEIFQVKELLERTPKAVGICRSKDASDELPDQPLKSTDPSFRGSLGCVLQCQTCGYKNPIRFDSFHSLSLPLPPDLSWGMESSLADCLMNFTSPEIVRDVECANCSVSHLHKVGVSGSPAASTKKPADSDGDRDRIIDASSETTQELKTNNNTIASKTPAENETLAKCQIMSGTVEIVKTADTPLTENCPKKSSIRPPLFRLDIGGTGVKKLAQKSKTKAQKPNASSSESVPIRRSFVRRLCFGKLPNCLCVHLQRLVWTRCTPMKKTNYIKFPDILDLSPYTDVARINNKKLPLSLPQTDFSTLIKTLSPKEMREALAAQKEARGTVRKESQTQKNGASLTKPAVCLQGGSERPAPYTSKSSSSKALYRLMSVIVHIGDWSFSGHFLAYRRVAEEGPDGQNVNRWICTSDSMVRKATIEEVFSCPAYMLFYERIKD